jgi:hypothetical protein
MVRRVIDERREKIQVTITRRMAVAAVAVLALVGAGGAVAASKSSGTPTATGGACPGRPGGGRGADFANAVASYLGVTKAELKTARDDGTSLAQLATEKGKSVSGLKDAIYADAKTHLDKDVAAGKLTAVQETSMLSNLQSHLDDIVNATGPPPMGPPPGASRAARDGEWLRSVRGRSRPA